MLYAFAGDGTVFFFIEDAGELRIFVLREKNEWSKYKRSNSHLEIEMREAEQRWCCLA
jgi:hypothetical protein